MPLPKLSMDELFDRVSESLEKMDRREAAKKRRREALVEKRWRERCRKRKNAVEKGPLFPTWASAGASSSELLDEELEADAVGSSSLADEELSDKEDSAPGSPPYKSKYSYPAPPAKTAPEPIPEEELIRRRKVEQELMALSKKITEEKKRQERMIPLVWDKPTFDPFPSSKASDAAAAADSADGDKSEAKEPQNPNPQKRDFDQVAGKKPYRNLNAIGVPPQASAYYARDESLYGPEGYSMGLGCYRKYSREEVDDFVAFVDKWIPTDPKWKIRKSSTESTDDNKDKDSTGLGCYRKY
eukprot:CAMPEP_0201696494 /NCGR_PEP_ID=MMETSP0578-20130828/8143_1 /ASSEMBLY_ACC=CAM_ASM_000663 /TAXON_ID=267565 /ORGANISM="Skeletonema grethea, Strain CCMP 1804" /LENGTH=298 /DNA_ID=CAMNT_0048182493 /DNA_START=116 /DNA_END=1009 /DNA_ORIENTATION=-